MIHEIVFSIPNIGRIKVNFKISFGSVERLYGATERTAKKNHFKDISQRIHIVSVDGGYYELDWERLTKIDLKQEILCQVLEIKERHEGNYIQVSKFNWIP
jgi:hydroxymethylpyrimidine pyrophosphatase-like HAD family hydrolase